MRPPTSVRADDTLWRAERKMARRRLKHLPVLDAGQVVGVVRERDVLAFRARSTHEEWWLSPVRTIMHEGAPAVAPDELAGVANEHLADVPDGMLPVVENNLLVGIVTATDLLESELHACASEPAITAADVMTEAPYVIAPSESLVVAARMMSDHDVRHLPVVEGLTVVGIVSERDLLPAVSAGGTSARRQVRDVMTTSVTAVAPDATLAEVSRCLVDGKLGAVPVLDLDRRLVGIVSYVDVLKTLAA